MHLKYVLGFFLCFCISAISYGQDGVGNISGKLMGDLQPANDAEVVLMNKDRLIDKTNTDENGNYSFLYVRPGHYDVKATKTGYRASIIIKVPVRENHTTKNDFYIPKFNTANTPSYPLLESYEDNCRNYMRNKTYRTKRQRRFSKYE